MPVFLSESGVWGYRFYGRVPGLNKRWSKQKTGFATKEMATAAMEAIKDACYRQRAANCKPGVKRIVNTVADLFDAWREDHEFRGASPVTISNIQGWFGRYCKPIADLLVCEVEADDIRTLITSLRKGYGGALADSTVQDLFRGLSAMFRYAMDLDLIASNPCAKIKMPKAKSGDYTIYTYAETRALLGGLIQDEDPLYWPLTLTARLGLRHGEVLGIRWCDINMDTGEIRIAHSLVSLNGAATLKTPKTSESSGAVYCPQLLLDELRAYRDKRIADGTYKLGELEIELPAKRSELDPHEFLCITKKNVIFTPRYSLAELHRAQREYNLRESTWHDLRHTWATHLIEENFEIAKVSKGLRHASLSVTADTYVQATEPMKRELTEAVDRCLDMASILGVEPSQVSGQPAKPAATSSDLPTDAISVTVKPDGALQIMVPPAAREPGASDATYVLCRTESGITSSTVEESTAESRTEQAVSESVEEQPEGGSETAQSDAETQP